MLIETLQHTSEIFKDIQDALIHVFQHLKCLKTLKNEIWDMLTDQLTYRKSDQVGQKIRKNDQNCHGILKSALFYLQIAQKCKKSKVGQTNQPTDRPTNRPTDRHSDLKSCKCC